MKLNIVCKQLSPKEYSPGLEGAVSALSEVNEGLYLWDEDKKEVYDMFYECSPDIIICTSNNISRTLSNALVKNPETKLVAIGQDTPAHSDPALTCYTGASGVNQYNLLPATNIVDYQYQPAKEIYRSEVTSISEMETPVIHDLSQFAVKCFSMRKKLRYPNYIGKITQSEITSILSSASVYLDVDGNNNILLSSMFNKSPCLSVSPTMFDVDLMPRPADAEELIGCIKALIFQKKFREEHIKKCYDFAIQNTCFHRIADILSLLGHEEHSKESLSAIGRFI